MPIPKVSDGDSIADLLERQSCRTEGTAVPRVTHRGGQQQGPCGADAVAACWRAVAVRVTTGSCWEAHVVSNHCLGISEQCLCPNRSLTDTRSPREQKRDTWYEGRLATERPQALSGVLAGGLCRAQSQAPPLPPRCQCTPRCQEAESESLPSPATPGARREGGTCRRQRGLGLAT